MPKSTPQELMSYYFRDDGKGDLSVETSIRSCFWLVKGLSCEDRYFEESELSKWPACLCRKQAH
jgi:hypothetical protein